MLTNVVLSVLHSLGIYVTTLLPILYIYILQKKQNLSLYFFFLIEKLSFIINNKTYNFFQHLVKIQKSD